MHKRSNLFKYLNPKVWDDSLKQMAKNRAKNTKSAPKPAFEQEGSYVINKAKELATGDIGKWVGIFGAAAVVSEFAETVMDTLKDIRVQAKSSTYYQKMLENNKSLMDEKPEDVAKLWASLYHNAPHLAQDPVAAGAFIKQSIDKELLSEYGGPPIDVYKTLSDIEGKYQQSGNKTTDKYISSLIGAMAEASAGS